MFTVLLWWTCDKCWRCTLSFWVVAREHTAIKREDKAIFLVIPYNMMTFALRHQMHPFYISSGTGVPSYNHPVWPETEWAERRHRNELEGGNGPMEALLWARWRRLWGRGKVNLKIHRVEGRDRSDWRQRVVKGVSTLVPNCVVSKVAAS